MAVNPRDLEAIAIGSRVTYWIYHADHVRDVLEPGFFDDVHSRLGHSDVITIHAPDGVMQCAVGVKDEHVYVREMSHAPLDVAGESV